MKRHKITSLSRAVLEIHFGFCPAVDMVKADICNAWFGDSLLNVHATNIYEHLI